ncbi:MAG: HAD family hydrolase [Methanobacteriota archaeon]
MKNTRWISFDLYGTLVDGGTRDLIEFLRDLLARHGSEATLEETLTFRERLIGDVSKGPFMTMRKRDEWILTHLFHWLSIEEPVAPAVERLYRSYFTAPLFPDAGAVVEALRGRGWKLALTTNCDNDMRDVLLARHGLGFDVTVTSEEARAYKPSAQIFGLLLERTGATPASMLHVGDSYLADMVGAHRAGIRTCFLHRPGGLPEDKRRTVEPDIEVEALADLLSRKILPDDPR